MGQIRFQWGRNLNGILFTYLLNDPDARTGLILVGVWAIFVCFAPTLNGGVRIDNTGERK
jgi:hypothetical protein